MKSAESTLSPLVEDNQPLRGLWTDAENEKLFTIPEQLPLVGEEQFLCYAEYLEDKPEPPQDEIQDACEIWPHITSYYDAALRASRQIDNDETPDTYSADGFTAWNQSRLAMFIGPNGKKALSMTSLVDSVASGYIRAVLSGREPFVDTIIRTLAYSGISVQPGEWRPTPPVVGAQRKGEVSAASYHQLHLFSPTLQTYAAQERAHLVASALRDVFREAKNAEYEGKCISGPYQERFAGVRSRLMVILAEAGIQVPFAMLQPESYSVDPEQRYSQMHKLSPRQQVYFAEVYRSKSDYFEKIAQETWKADKAQTIAEGVFDVPVFLPEKEVMRCANAAFRMVFEGVTGVRLSEAVLNNAIYAAHGTTFITDIDYLKVFNTQAFKENFDSQVQSINFAAMDFATLGRIGMRAKDKGHRVIVVTTLGTEFASDKNVQHRVVLLAVGDDTVTIHDPSPDAGPEGNARVISKQEFCRRWAMAQNSGYLVLAR